jgi:MoaA/NifB/PqqE/SkfB family radical SAM enzyme
MDMMENANPMESVFQIGKQAGLSDEDVKKAASRITLSLASMMSGGLSSQEGTRLYEGFTKNLVDNPMLVGWVLRVAAHASDTVWQKFVDNFLLGIVFERKAEVEALKQELGYQPPITIVINPTMRCGLRCTGCYAWSYERHQDMDRALLERVLREARDLGIHFITITGGEPFLYPELEDLFASFPDLIFHVYTNAQHIDAARAQRLAKLGNVWPAISVEGYEAETDARRGKGVHKKLINAMANLKKEGVLFGISAVPTRKNTETLASDEFIDYYLSQGALFGWMFTYLPVGRDPDVSLMATPAQRDYLRKKSLHWRKTKPFFMADFWNDGPLCGGCMSASRFTFITNEGWAQPCTFVHYATHNIKEHSLRQIFDSQFFRCIREKQPYGDNLLRPCKIIDHPHVLEEVVSKCHANPTYPGADNILKDPVVRAHLHNYSEEYQKLADEAWESEEYQSGHSVQVPFFGRVDLHKVYAWRFKKSVSIKVAPAAYPREPIANWANQAEEA